MAGHGWPANCQVPAETAANPTQSKPFKCASCLTSVRLRKAEQAVPTGKDNLSKVSDIAAHAKR